MGEVDTLYKICLKKVVEETILEHPLNITHIPHTIFEDVWDVQTIKNLQQEESAIFNMIMVMISEYNDAVMLFNHHCDIYDKVSLEMQKIEMAYPQDENSSPAPAIVEKMRTERVIMFNKLLENFSRIDDKMMEIDIHIMIKKGKFDVIVKEKKKLQLRFDLKFNLDDEFEVHLDDEFERSMSVHNRRINQNRIFLHHEEGG